MATMLREITTEWTAAPWPSASVLACCAIAMALLQWRRARLTGTTLTGAWWWALVSLAAIALLHPADSRAPGAAPLWFVGATSTFCPGAYVLGARRPHAGAWHFVVLSMWGILALPAIEVIFLSRGMDLELGPIRGWFLWLAIAVVSLNYLPTRHWLSAMLFAAGQMLLLSPFLPLLANRSGAAGGLPTGQLWGVALLAAALAIAALRPPRSQVNLHPLDIAWLSFRDAFGGLWALRVLERMTAAGRTYGWPVSLGWSGFYFHEGVSGWSDVNEKTVAEVQQTLDNLRRRFVDLRQQ